jgi:hypothetical protein
MYGFRALTVLGIVGAIVGIVFGVKGVVTAKHASDSVNRKGGDGKSLFHAGNLDKALGKLKARVGDDGRLLSLTVYPGYLVADASTGSEDKGKTYRVQEDGSVKELPLTLNGPGQLKDNIFPIAKLNTATVEKLANQAAAKEHLDLNGVTHIVTMVQPDSGKPGIAVYLNDQRFWRAALDGSGLSNPDQQAKKAIANADTAVKQASSEADAASSAAGSVSSCVQAAGTDVTKLQACTK